MKHKYYVLLIWKDIEPELFGPYSRARIRDKRAKALRTEHGYEHGIFSLDITARGMPKVGAYSGKFFMEQET
ncbi:MAG: hypothetical protein A2283_24315 [Lentisphaerae bacterium RIFOXYA12_FULL_48_11]|nr:MAG: hypothetical protein A2283_24315 [Lentisphaerae bacterium RIFOXYA12_FULL_48_11]